MKEDTKILASDTAGSRWRAVMTLLLFWLIAFTPGLIGANFAPDAWYESLNKPQWNPPPWIFAPVWTALYLLIGVAGYVAWISSKAAARRVPFSLYAMQLALNALWTPLFFGLHRSGWALAVLLALVAAVIGNVVLFYRIKRVAAYLLLPYLAWVTFAALLNAAIVNLN